MAKIKILLLIDVLSDGGGARVASIIANELTRRNYEMSIGTDLSEAMNYDICKDIKLHDIKFKNGDGESYDTVFERKVDSIKHMILIVKQIRALINQIKPDCIITFFPPIFFLTKISTIKKSIPIIATEHTCMDRKIGAFEDFIRKYTYKYADALTVLTKVDLNLVQRRCKNIVVMPNPIQVNNIYPVSKEKYILAVGRINEYKIKGFDILIQAWGILAPKYPEWSLLIVGNGNERSRNELDILSSNANLRNNIQIRPFTKDIYAIMRESAIFVLPSRIEGFGLTLIEAMSNGCACICFDTGGRQAEIVESIDNAIVLTDKNYKILSEALALLIEKEDMRENLSRNAINLANKYSIENIIKKWDALIRDVVRQNSKF